MPLLTTTCHDIIKHRFCVIFNFWKNDRILEEQVDDSVHFALWQAHTYTHTHHGSKECVVSTDVVPWHPVAHLAHTEKEFIEVCSHCYVKIG